MRTLTQQEKRTVFVGAAVIVGALVLLGAAKGLNYFSAKRADYRKLLAEATTLQQQVQPYQDKVEVIKKLMENFRLDPSKLSRTSLVAEASAAIQQTAQGGGVVLGPVRESPARASSKELASIQLEGSGPIPAITAFLSRLEHIGFPIIIDSVQLNSDMRPGMIKMTLTLVILDFEQWKEPAHV